MNITLTRLLVQLQKGLRMVYSFRIQSLEHFHPYFSNHTFACNHNSHDSTTNTTDNQTFKMAPFLCRIVVFSIIISVFFHFPQDSQNFPVLALLFSVFTLNFYRSNVVDLVSNSLIQLSPTPSLIIFRTVMNIFVSINILTVKLIG